jgi:hypothetical protein
VAAGGHDVFEIYLWSMKIGRLLEVFGSCLLISADLKLRSSYRLVLSSPAPSRPDCSWTRQFSELWLVATTKTLR